MTRPSTTRDLDSLAAGGMGGEAQPDLRWWHIALLRVLDERGGFTAGTLGKDVWKTADGRSAASTATPALKALERWGYASRLDDARPVIWVRTPAGTEALAQKNAKRLGRMG